MKTPTTLYCKKADLLLISSSGRRTYKSNSDLYFLPTRNYTPIELENEIRTRKDEVLQKLNKIYEGRVLMTIKEDPIKEIKVIKVENDLIDVGSGLVHIRALIEI